VKRVLDDEHVTAHKNALEEVGTLAGDCLLPTILMLNPYRVIVSGRLAVPVVRDALVERLDSFTAISRVFGDAPDVIMLEGPENHFAAVRGAALAVLRQEVHRNFETLYGAPEKLVTARFADLTWPLTSCPW